MKMSRNILSLVLAGAITVSMASCSNSEDTSSSNPGSGSTSADSGTSVTLSLTHGQATTHPFQKGAERFAELVAEKTEGNVHVEIYPAAQIASGAKAIEYVQMGTSDIALESTMSTENFIPETGVLNLPFLFENEDQVFSVLDGDVGNELETAAESKGFKILCWMYNGFRDISNSVKPITCPEDLKGLKIRVPESQVFIKTFESLGAIPTPMAVSEVFTAMQLKTVDGQENPSSIFINQKYNEVNPYYSVTHHIFTAEPLIMNLDKFNSLSADDQTAVLEAAQEAAVYQRQVAADMVKEEMQQIKDSGVSINKVEDMTAFKEAVQPVYDAFNDQYGSLLEKIHSATN